MKSASDNGDQTVGTLPLKLVCQQLKKILKRWLQLSQLVLN